MVRPGAYPLTVQNPGGARPLHAAIAISISSCPQLWQRPHTATLAGGDDKIRDINHVLTAVIHDSTMGLTAEQYAQLAAAHEKAAGDHLIPLEQKTAFARKANWFRILARLQKRTSRRHVKPRCPQSSRAKQEPPWFCVQASPHLCKLRSGARFSLMTAFPLASLSFGHRASVSPCRAAALRLSNGLKSNLWDHPEGQMKFVVATLSLLVLLALSGSVVAMVAGISGFLPKELSAPKEASASK